MLLPVSSFGGDCTKADRMLDKVSENEQKLLELENQFPDCVKVNNALLNYYYERNIWKAAKDQCLKIQKYYPDNEDIEILLLEIEKKIPQKIVNDEDLKKASQDIKMRGLAGIKPLRPMSPLIKFDFNSANLDEEDKKLLDRFAKMLTKTGAKIQFQIQGHTDKIGTYQYNKDLSLKRAAAVKKYLVSVHGFGPDNLEIEGYGFEIPLDTNETEAGRRENRRVQFEGTIIVK